MFVATEVVKPNVSRAILERLHSLDDLPHFPSALMKLEQLLASHQTVHLEDVANLVAQDPRLAAGLIGVVNSAKYSPGFKVADLTLAVNRIGTSDVRMMAHAINYKSAIKTKPPFSEKEFMQHAMLAAFIGQSLAKEVHINPGEGFLCGLMHDIGIYLLSTENRETYKSVMLQVMGDARNLVAIENRHYQTAHPILGARLLQQWKFPSEIVMGVAGHHAPESSDSKYQAYAFLTSLAELGAYRDGLTNGVVGSDNWLNDQVLQGLDFFGLSESTYQELIADAYDNAVNCGLA